jgi:hypothetical protein
MKRLTARIRRVNKIRRARARTIGVLVGALLVTLAAVTTVSAQDHRVPRAILHVSGEGKRLHPWSFEWLSRSGPNECVGVAGDGVPNFRPRADVRVHSEPRVVFHKRQRPHDVRALASHRRSDDGDLADARKLPVRLRTRERDGHPVWVAIMEVTVRHRLFVDVTAHWRDEDGCGVDQNASWDFGLKHD